MLYTTLQHSGQERVGSPDLQRCDLDSNAKTAIIHWRIRRSTNRFPVWRIARTVESLQEWRQQVRNDGYTVGFVPTMGALHDGHFALIRQAAKENAHVYVSIYVNPTQFGVNEDLDKYPKTFGEDTKKLANLNKQLLTDPDMGTVTAVFAPHTSVMYPGLPPTSQLYGEGSFVTISPISTVLEGASRPVFFRGVATIVMKLLNIVKPERVYFGQKDIQQTLVIGQMVKDFYLDTRVRIGATIRERDGLAMSSRNVFLGPRRRKIANILVRALWAMEMAHENGAILRTDLLAAANFIVTLVQEEQQSLPPYQRVLFEVDYLSVASPRTMMEVDQVLPWEGAILSGAIKMLPIEEPQKEEQGGQGDGTITVRLIDNVLLNRDLVSEATGNIYLPENETRNSP